MKINLNYLDLLNRNLKEIDIDKYFTEIENKDKVVFYFHGGLSSSNYVGSKLGPYLLDTMFSPNVLNTDDFKTHIIFFRYETGVFQLKKLKGFLSLIVKSRAMKMLFNFLYPAFNKLNNKIKQKSFEKNMSEVEYDSFFKEQLKEYAHYNLIRDFKNYYYDEDDNKIDDKGLSGKLKVKRYKILKKALLLILGRLNVIGAFIRIGVRFYKKTDHGVNATIAEELIKIKLLKPISNFAINHWNIVHEHSEEIWENTSGKYFLKKLNELVKTRVESNNPLLIDIVSHSAGAISASYLIKNIQSTDIKINNALLIVPAVRFQLFEKTFYKYNNICSNLKIYLLADKDEGLDSVIPYKNFSFIYDRSLLFIVSGVAEKGDGYSDMTIVGMHRYYKKHKTYDTYSIDNPFFGNVQLVKNNLIENNNLVFITKNTLNDDYFNQRIITTNGATHSFTKLPHKSSEIAKELIKIISESNTLPEEVDTSSWLEKAREHKLD